MPETVPATCAAPPALELVRRDRRERFRERPLLTLAWLAATGVERIVLSGPVVRALRMSNQIVAEFARP